MKIRLILLLMLFSQFGFAQIGIGTTEPTPGTMLDVKGSALVRNEFKLNNFQTGIGELNGNYKFITRLLDSEPQGKLTRLNFANLDVAPVNIIDYSFSGVTASNLVDVDLQFDSSKYIVVFSNLRYGGDATPRPHMEKGEKRTPGFWPWSPDVITYPYQGNFVGRTFVSNETWHLELRNRNLVSSSSVPYSVTIVVYDKKYFKQLTAITGNFSGGTTGSVLAPTGL